KMSDIADAVGVGQSTLYLYFPNKQALFIECVDEVLDAMLCDFNTHLKDIDDVIEKSIKTGDLVLHSYPQFIEILHVLDNIAGEDPNMAAKRKEVINTITSIMKDQLEEAVSRGAIPDGDVTIASHILIGVAEGLLRLSSIDDHYSVDVIMKEIETFMSDSKTFEASIKIMSSYLSKIEWGADTKKVI
ncbi:MAG: TetR/AcrR family transcriptional regulator, partial [Actinobacteria bacterium]|nr:TetR/AcrR family transcriptional regulator [Actinomycetota bacterium]